MRRGKSIRAHCLPLSVLAAVPKISTHLIAFDPSPEGEYIAGLRVEFDVMHVYRAFNSSGLVRAFEMSGELIAVLFDLNIFGGSPAVGVFGVNRPVACHVVWWLFPLWLLGQGNITHNN